MAIALPAAPTADQMGHTITYATPTPSGQGDPIPQTGRALEIVFKTGERFVFSEAAGRDQGSYVGPFVSQHSIMVTRQDCALTVFFRRDTAGPSVGREEIVVELGKLYGAANLAAANLPAYDAFFYKDGQKVHAEGVPFHWWFSRWRWPRADRPLVRTKEQVNALYKFAPASSNQPQSTLPLDYRWAMDNAAGRGAMTYAMGDPGDRNELGLATEPQAEFLLTGNPVALQSVLAQAETSASIPYHQRDEVTGALVDLIKHSQMHWYWRPDLSQPAIAREEYVQTVMTYWSIEDSHMGALPFVPFMLTDDPFYLEELQAQTNYNIGFTYYHRVNDGAINGVAQPVYNPSETRGFAWSVRTGAQTAYASPTNPPSWLLGKDHYTTILDINLAYFNRVLKNESWPQSAAYPAAGPWHFPVDPTIYSGFMVDYIVWSFAHAVNLGYTGWLGPMQWSAWLPKQHALNTGWSPQWPVPYHITPEELVGITPGDMKAAWDSFVKTNPDVIPDNFPKTGWAQDNSTGYAGARRAVFNVLTQFGDQEAAVCLKNIGPMADDLMAKAGGYPYRWSFAETPDTAPDPMPQPTGEPEVTTTESDYMAQVKAAVNTVKADVAKYVADARAKIAAIIAGNAGNADQSAELQAVLADLNTLHETLTTEDAAINS